MFLIIFFHLSIFQCFAQQNKVEDLIDSVNKTAEKFSQDFIQLSADLDTAVKSEERATAKFDKMLKSVDSVLNQLGDNSDIWQQSEALLKQFENNRENSQKKATSPSAPAWWKKSVKKWAVLATKLRKVRDDILSQRAKLMSSKKDILDSKDIAIDQIKLGDAENAVQQMIKIRDHLKTINNDLQNIVKETKQINLTNKAPTS